MPTPKLTPAQVQAEALMRQQILDRINPPKPPETKKKAITPFSFILDILSGRGLPTK